MPTRQQLESALRNAASAGDDDAARSLANALKQGSYNDEPATVAPRPASDAIGSDAEIAPRELTQQAGQPLIDLPEGMTQDQFEQSVRAPYDEIRQDIEDERRVMASERGLQWDEMDPKERDARVPDPTFRKMLWEGITGERRKTEETESLPRLGRISKKAYPTGEDLKRAAAFMLSSGPDERVKMLKEAVPDMSFRYDKRGNIIGKFPSGEEGVLNAPGFGFTDALKIASEAGKYAPATGASRLGATALAKLGWNVGASTSLATVYEALSAAGGGEFEPSQVIAEGIGAGLSEIPTFLKGRKTGLLPSKATIEETTLKLLGKDTEAAEIAAKNFKEFETSAKAIGGEGVGTFAQRSGVEPLLRDQSFLSMMPATQTRAFNALKAQNEQVAKIAQSFVERYAPVEVLESGAHRFKIAAKEALDKELKTLQEKAKPFYDEASKMVPELQLPKTGAVDLKTLDAELASKPQINVDDVLDMGDAFIEESAGAGRKTPIGNELRKALDLLEGSDIKVKVPEVDQFGTRIIDIKTGKPKSVSYAYRLPATFTQLDSAKKLMDEIIGGKTKTILTDESERKLVAIKNALVDKMDEATLADPANIDSSVYAKARGIYSEDMPSIIALNEGLLGKASRMKDVTFKNMSEAIFDASETNPSILKRVRALTEQVDPGAMDDMIGIQLTRGLNKVGIDSSKAPVSQARDIYNAMFGQKGEKLRPLMLGASKDGAANIRHFERWLGRLSRGFPGGSDTTPKRQLEERLQKGFLQKIAASFGVVKKVGSLGTLASDTADRRMRDTTMEKNAHAISKILFSPELAPRFKEIVTKDLRGDSSTVGAYRALSRLYNEALGEIEEIVPDTPSPDEPVGSDLPNINI